MNHTINHRKRLRKQPDDEFDAYRPPFEGERCFKPFADDKGQDGLEAFIVDAYDKGFGDIGWRCCRKNRRDRVAVRVGGIWYWKET